MEITKQYIAGFFDGEGHVSITWSQKGKSRNPKLCVKISNTFLPVLLKITELYGGHLNPNKKAKESYLQCYTLTLMVEESKIFLNDMLPFLVIKRAQAIAALRFSETVYKRGKRPVSEEENKIRQECMDFVKIDKQKHFGLVKNEDFGKFMNDFEIQHRQLIKDHVKW